MDRHPRNALLEGVAQALLLSESTKTPSGFRGNPKRYAIYFGSKASMDAKGNEMDTYSTWEFSAPTTPLSRNSSDTGYESGSRTPAQEIATRYRASHSLDRDNETRYSSPSLYSEPDSWDTASLEMTSISPDKDLKVVYRESRHDALQSAFQEAINVVKTYGVDYDGNVVCQRPGCRDALPNLKAFSYHLHIHDIHDRFNAYAQSEDCFEDQRAIESHRCEKPRRVSIPATSLLATFQRVLSKIF